MAAFSSYKLSVNGQDMHFFAPENDHTIYGTLSCIQNRKFHIDDVGFQDGDVFVDIGCNVGLLSMLVAILYPKVKVYSFDASPTAIEALRMGVAANGLLNLQAYNVAIGAKFQKDIKFFSDGQNASCLIEDALRSGNNFLDATVNKIPVDEIFDSTLLGIDRVKFLKMDIEGGEFEIFDRLFSQRTDILDRVDFLHLEVHEFKELNPDGLRTKITERFGSRVFFDT